jgi:(1->4)-alpha-D-glucan 1-alpha-D-glucosylmutase
VVGLLEHRIGMTAQIVPTATYRLQLTAAFGFRDAARIVPYLRALGISHVYASPILMARAGSTHGYDMVDPTRLNPELGGDEGFAELVAALRAAELGLIVDFVPNHMGVLQADNPWWLDVLEWGRASPHARAFDIEWNALPFRSRGGILIPILGRPYGEALDAGEIELRYDAREGSFSAWYFEHRLPIAPPCYRAILQRVVRGAGASDAKAGRALLALARAQGGLGHPTYGEAPAFKAALVAIDGGAEVIAAGLAAFRPAGGGAGALHRLLERQAYRPAHWRLAGTQINYRRFFDINSLAGLRVEDEQTFGAVHARIARLVADGSLAGLRLDHIDGLADPAGYCGRLRRMVTRLRPPADRPFPVYVEKILGEGERLPGFDGVDGTTGYEWLNVISRVLVDPAGLPALDRTWRDVSGETRPFAAILDAAKRAVLETLLASEFRTLCRLLSRIAAGQHRTRDLDDDRLRAALEAFIIRCPVYRTYVTADGGASAADRQMIDRIIAATRQDVLQDDRPVLDFLRDAVTLDLISPRRVGYSRVRVRRFVRKLQQLTGPAMAKALEDTAFYRFHRLIALNEVGGHPAASGLAIDGFHRLMRERIADGAAGLTTTATHDTKRGEDARARILALSEIPQDWAGAVARWQAASARFVRHSGTARAPTAVHEYMLYQALIGAWPLDRDIGSLRERFQGFARKAAREGKQETSWLAPDEAYEATLAAFIDGIVGDDAFVRDFDGIARRAALLGALNGLSQVALKIAMPGTPDFYQGTELWDLSLVDPDNRRPVDFAARERALAAPHEDDDLRALGETWADGRIKLAVTRRLLAWRGSRSELFARGDYQPLTVDGAHRDHVIAFARILDGEAAILVAGRHFAPLTDGGRHWPRTESWQGDVVLSGLSLRDGPGGEAGPVRDRLPLAQAFAMLPVAVFTARVRAPAVAASR